MISYSFLLCLKQSFIILLRGESTLNVAVVDNDIEHQQQLDIDKKATSYTNPFNVSNKETFSMSQCLSDTAPSLIDQSPDPLEMRQKWLKNWLNKAKSKGK